MAEQTPQPPAGPASPPAEAGPSYLPPMGHDRLLPLYDPLTWVLRMRTAHRRLADQAGLRPGDRVLEIGCGTGNLALLVKRRHPETTVVGLDPDPRALARAGRKARRTRRSVHLERGFAGALPYPDASFDRVLSAFMLHHLEPADRQAALREARRVLAPSGSLHVVDFGGDRPSRRRRIRRPHRSARRHGTAGHAGHTGDGIPALMTAAGLADAAETGHHDTLLGPCTFYRANR
jgi:SAM-dependent methyltransferase